MWSSIKYILFSLPAANISALTFITCLTGASPSEKAIKYLLATGNEASQEKKTNEEERENSQQDKGLKEKKNKQRHPSLGG